MVETENIVRFPDAGAIEAEAAEWLVRLDRGALTDEESVKFLEWLARSPVHRDMFERLSAEWDRLDAVRIYAEPLPSLVSTNSGVVKSRRVFYWRFAAAAVLALTLVGSGIAYWNWPEPTPVVTAYETPVGKQRTVTLNDGTTVLLNTASKIEVAYSRKKRNVRLLRGEAYFEVVHDPAREFQVTSGDRYVRDIGTAFAVRKAGQALEVTVAKGTVELAVAPVLNHVERLAVLNAGQSAAFDDKLAYIKRLNPVELTRQLSWRDGVLIYAGEPLAKVVADYSRYTNAKIELADPRLASTPVYGYFEIGKLSAVFEALESNFGVHAEWIDGAHVRLAAVQRDTRRGAR